MTDEELDSLLIEILNEYLAETKEDAEYIKNQKSKDYKEVKEDYHFVIEHLSNLLPAIHSLDDLAEMDEEGGRRIRRVQRAGYEGVHDSFLGFRDTGSAGDKRGGYGAGKEEQEEKLFHIALNVKCLQIAFVKYKKNVYLYGY